MIGTSIILNLLITAGLLPSALATGLVPSAGLTATNTPAVVWHQATTDTIAEVVPPEKKSVSLGIATTAKAAIVVDQLSGAALFEKEADTVLPLASITKLASALVFLGTNPEMTAITSIGSGDDAEGGRLNVTSSETMTVSDLLYTALVGSGNNATNALATASGLSRDQFVAKMNDLAVSLGLTKTHFVEPTGLDPLNVSTARETIKLAEYAFHNSQIRAALETDVYEFRTINTNQLHRIRSTNDILNLYPWRQKTIGKTGFINEVGFSLVTQAERDNTPVLLVAVLGSDSEAHRFNEAKGLIEWTYDNYTWPEAGS